MPRTHAAEPQRPAEKSIFWAKLLPLTLLCESGLLPATDGRMPHLPTETQTKSNLICYETKYYSPNKHGGSYTARVRGSGVPLRSIGWVGRAAAWQRASTPGRSLPRRLHPATPNHAPCSCRILDPSRADIDSVHGSMNSTNASVFRCSIEFPINTPKLEFYFYSDITTHVRT